MVVSASSETMKNPQVQDSLTNPISTSPSFSIVNKITANSNRNHIHDKRNHFPGLNKKDIETTIWACSPLRRNLLGKRSLLADRKQFFEHVRPRAVIFSTVRIGIIQGGQVVSTFLTDQLEYESANEELVIDGTITPVEADQMNEEWEENEWKKRWEQFPKRFVHAFLKLHSAIIFMRLYEHLAEHLFSTRILDKLTKDTFKSAKRKYEKYEHLENKRIIVGKKMFYTCLWANAISFLSDYTVQQCILLTGHCMYYKHQRKVIRDRIRERKRNDRDGEDSDEDDSRNEIGAGGIGLSYALKSSSLLFSRGTSWIVSSGSGAIGSAIYPGWGTLFGTQLGDGIVGALMDG